MGEGSGAAGTKSFKTTDEVRVNIGIRSMPQLLEDCKDGDLDIMRVPGEDVDQSPDYMRYEPKRCKMLPANLQTMGFHIVETAVVA